jgi:anti-sigma factor RsiW
MSCDKVRSDLTAYLDGELTDDRGSAVRGHLRTCEACRGVARDEAALRDGLRALPPLDPPGSLWAGVQQRLADEEVADAKKPGWRRLFDRYKPRLPQVAFGSAVLAAAVALLVLHARRTEEAHPVVSAPVHTNVEMRPSVETPPPAPPAPVPAADDERDVTDVLATAQARVTDEYAATVRELIPLATEARAKWPAAQQQEFDAQLADLQKTAAAAHDERGKQRGYRAVFRYLQRAAIRDEIALASTGDAP